CRLIMTYRYPQYPPYEYDPRVPQIPSQPLAQQYLDNPQVPAQTPPPILYGAPFQQPQEHYPTQQPQEQHFQVPQDPRADQPPTYDEATLSHANAISLPHCKKIRQ